MLAADYFRSHYRNGEAVPYRSNERERRNNLQLGVGSPLWGNMPPTPIPERVLDGIPGFLAWLAFLFSIASAVAFPRTLLLIAALVGLYTAIRFVLAGIANVYGLRLIRQWEKRDWNAYYAEHATETSLPLEVVHHLVLIPNYKEPLSVMRRTLQALAEQEKAAERMTIVLAMEAGEEGCVAKAETLQAEYAHYFRHFHFTVHPRGLPGEMQCKSANVAWAARWIKRKLVDELGYNIDHICVTTMDADTRWHPKHFQVLSVLFALDDERHNRFWQGSIRYHGKIWEINPLLRIVNAYATAIELSYLAAPWWKALPMSSYSLSLRLLERSGYWDGDVIADEWHMFIKAYFANDGILSVKPIMLPFIADATVGENLLDELRERYLQTLRHSWGSKEIGYMLAKIIDHPEVPILPSLRLLVRISHDILMAGAGWAIITVGSQFPVLLHPSIAPVDIGEILSNPAVGLQNAANNLIADPTWLILISASTMVVVLAFVFWILDVTVRPPRTHRMSLPERFWTILSFPLMPILTLLVVAIPALQAQTLLLLGVPLQFRVSKKV